MVAFDPDRGLGTVRDDGGSELAFHCTALADGTRSVEVGTRVVYVIAAGHRGLVEARGLATLGHAGG